MRMNIPTEQDWENYWDDLDAKWAHKVFAGKSNDEVQVAFRNCVIEKMSDLWFMPIKPFQYYMYGFKQFIDKGKFDDEFDASDAVSCFINLVANVLEEKPGYIKPILNDLMPTLEHISENQLEYGADIDIYGHFPVKLDRIKALAANA